MGLLVSVLRHANFPDCSLNGLSAQHAQICVVNMDGPFDPHPNSPAFLLVNHYRDACALFPAEHNGDKWFVNHGIWWQMGGNFAHTSDSRFNEAIRRLTGIPFYGALAIHDRRE